MKITLPVLALLLTVTQAFAGETTATEVRPGFANRLRGGAEVLIEDSYDDVCSAADKALNKLEFRREPEKKDALVANYFAITADDKKVKVRVSRVTEKTTRVEIQVGLLGDEAATRAIIDKLKSLL